MKRFGAGIFRMTGQHHTLTVHHARNGKLNQIPQSAVLYRFFGKRNGALRHGYHYSPDFS